MFLYYQAYTVLNRIFAYLKFHFKTKINWNLKNFKFFIGENEGVKKKDERSKSSKISILHVDNF